MDCIAEDMWRLKIQGQDDQGGQDSHCSPSPDCPGKPDCTHYLRTGMCSFGSNSRFNHPANTGQVMVFNQFPRIYNFCLIGVGAFHSAISICPYGITLCPMLAVVIIIIFTFPIGLVT